MGFTKEQAANALSRAGNNITGAIDILTNSSSVPCVMNNNWN